jgi:hypothetical protein
MKRSTMLVAMLCTVMLVAFAGAKTQGKIDP